MTIVQSYVDAARAPFIHTRWLILGADMELESVGCFSAIFIQESLAVKIIPSFLRSSEDGSRTVH
jgi:hypothetical protein